MAKRVGAVLGTLVLAVGVLLGCQTQSPTSASTTAPLATQAPSAQSAAATPASAAAPETITVGLMYPLSGPPARNGIISERFTRMGIDDVNAKGGIKAGGKSYLLEAVTADEKFTAEGGREAANRLVLADKVNFIIGATTSIKSSI